MFNHRRVQVKLIDGRLKTDVNLIRLMHNQHVDNLEMNVPLEKDLFSFLNMQKSFFRF